MVLKFITSNIHKYEEALLIGEKYEINISHENLEYVESQNDSFSEIARFSLDNLKGKIQGDFFIEDAGLVIECLNGFPGPYSSFVYSTIGNQGILELMRNEKNRNAKFISTVAL
ncbi:MAG: non-canonical purine NTP pyrophosphatase, partial [Candidatus Kariarchaeum pelagius]